MGRATQRKGNSTGPQKRSRKSDQVLLRPVHAPRSDEDEGSRARSGDRALHVDRCNYAPNYSDTCLIFGGPEPELLIALKTMATFG